MGQIVELLHRFAHGTSDRTAGLVFCVLNTILGVPTDTQPSFTKRPRLGKRME